MATTSKNPVIAAPGDEPKMSFLEHLDELRRGVIRSMLALIAAFLICWPFAPRLLEVLSRPVTQFLPEGGSLAYMRLTEPFFAQLKVAALAGVFLASPYILLQVWLFVAPGLYRNEKRYAVPFVVSASLFFLLGAWFAFQLLFPPVCKFFLDVGQGFQMVVTLDQYLSLLFWTVLGVALTFELPVITGLLARLGIIDARLLLKNFHIAVVGCLVVAAVITPTPDALTMLFVAAPMLLLYIVSIGVAHVLGRRDADGDEPA